MEVEVVAVEVDEVEDVAGIGPPIDAVPDIIIIPTAAVAAVIDAMMIVDRRLLPVDGDMAMAMADMAMADAAEDGRAVPGPHDNRPIGSRPKR
jgi:hypothetical protein